MKNIVFLAIAALTVTSLTGCLASKTDLEDYVANSGVGLVGQVTPLPPVVPFQPITYVGETFLDPFISKMQTKKQETFNSPDSSRKKEFLETFGLDQLRLVGTIKKGKDMWGMVQTPDKNINLVKSGHFLGNNYGKITSVGDASLTLKETIQDPSGSWIERETTIETK